jgi:hypothetical protein
MSHTSNTKIILAGLDFDSIKTNLKTFLQSQSVFQDFNFEGAALSQLLNLLSYNTYQLSFYMNMIASEMFLQTAVMQPNIVSHAKLLGYTPRSATASESVVNVAITKLSTDPTTILTLPRFTQFSSIPLNGQSFNFVTVDSHTVANTGLVFNFNEVVIKEGQPVTKTFVVDNATNPQQLFDLTDPNIDTKTIQIIVQTSATNPTQAVFTIAQNAVAVNGDSNVYYLDQGISGNYRIYFGDGILGAQLDDGNLVIVSYIITSADAANGIQTFRLQNQILSGSVSNTTTAIQSAAGSIPESAQSVKFSAPLSYIAQNRAVTVNDYQNLINREYPYFDAVNVWGGEEQNPPVYGAVFISAKPKEGFAITQAQKQFVIKNILQPSGVLTVLPQFVDPDYNFLNFNITIYYDSTATNFTANQISGIVKNAVIDWTSENLNKFNSTFKYSRFLRAIDDSNPTIQSSTVDFFIEKRFDPSIGITKTYTLDYGTPLFRGVGTDRLYSSPSFTQIDQSGVSRQCFIEEVPESITGIQSVNVIAPGSGFTSPPTLLIEGDGEGANAFALIVNGKIQSVVVDAPGANYTSATIIVQGTGSGAVLQVVSDGARGNLRSYFFDQNSVKTVLANNVGVVNYVNGLITLNDFRPLDVGNPTQTLAVHIKPQNNNFGSNLNRLITFDTNDNGALSITVNVENH